MREALILLHLFTAISFLRADNCNCSQKFRPVCGSDGVTYDNKCLLDCAGAKNTGCGTDKSKHLVEAYSGICCPQTICPLARDPLCDNYGRTHINECFFNRARCLTKKIDNRVLVKSHVGKCLPSEVKPEDCENLCVPLGGPVCDEAGNTHDSECSLEQVNCNLRKNNKEEVALVHFGYCEAISTPNVSIDVSDLIEETTGSGQAPTELSSENRKAELSSVLNQTIFYVRTARIDLNTSEDKEKRGVDKEIPPLVIHSQPFDITQPCSAVNCDKTWNPVCDSTNKTHRNLCLFKFYACKVNRLDGSSISMAYDGECVDLPPDTHTCRVCSSGEKRSPVCDNLNQTHPSLCEISRFNCMQRDLNLPERVLVQIGSCHSRSPVFSLSDEQCPTSCSSDWKPVCDEVGVTHSNFCQFQKKNCVVRKKGRRAPMLKFLRDCSNDGSVTGYSAETEEVTTGMVMLRSEATVQISHRSEENETLSTEHYVVASTTAESTETTTTSSVRFECPTPSCSEDTSFPVCDSLGHIHENVCSFTYARCIAAQKGVFLTIDQEEKCISANCNEVCSNETKPLCATDFITYQNFCHYSKQKCVDHSLDLLFYGHCSECLPSPCLPLPENAPDSSFVCDSEDTTRSLCEFQMLSCIVEKNGGLNFTLQYIGKCCGKPDSCFEEKSEPLCGSEGRTYRNKCEFDMENCRNEKLMVPTNTMAYSGECKESAPFSEDLGDMAFGRTEIFNSPSGNESLVNITCPSMCDNIYAPVCGSDDVTYTNLCFLQTENCRSQSDLKVLYEGECCEVQCPTNFSPVCDSKGITHQNLCFFGKERCVAERLSGQNLSIAKFDVCTDDCAVDCPNTYLPICGSNGHTYINQCELDIQNCFVKKNITSGVIIQKDYAGECCPDQKCDYAFSPVCDSEGMTHANDCVFKREACVQAKKYSINVTVQYKGACCNQPCEDLYSPVCDGQSTHENPCRFRIAQCEAERRGEVLSVSYPGECCVASPGHCNSSETVCDSEGQTHTDMCKFRHRKCIVERTAKKTLTIVHPGECCSIDNCKKGEEPVCDNHGGTHASLCHFENTKCIHDKIHPNDRILLSYRGPCCPGNCSDVWDPVCDQHGSLYKNKCFFTQNACEQQRKYDAVLLETPCPQRRIRRLR